MSKAKKPKSSIKVVGHWVFPSDTRAADGAKAYYVKPYKRKPPKLISKRKKVILRKAKHIEESIPRYLRPPPKGYVLAHHYENVEPEERVAYTYKVEILVSSDYKYNMTFAPSESVPRNVKVLQYWHSKFEPSIKTATVDFLEKVPEIRAYGQVDFISIDLYRVSGEGQLRFKRWQLLRSFDEPEDVK